MAVLWFASARSLSDFSKPQRRASLAVRGTMVLLLILSLAGLTWNQSTRERFLVVAVDQSLSIDGSVAEISRELLEEISASRGRAEVVYMPFATIPGMISSEPLSLLKSSTRLPMTPESQPRELPFDRSGTNLEAAIETASGLIPPGYIPEIILLTDGNETEGDAVAAATRSHIPISTLALPSKSEPEVQVADVKVPTEVREGEPFYVEATIISNHDDEGLVEIYQGDHKVVSERKALATGFNTIRIQQSIERDRMATFKIRVSGLKQDTLLDNNADSGLVYTSGKPRVLIVESDVTLIQELRYALEDEGILVEVRPPQGMPDTVAALQNFELVILSDVPANELTLQQMEVIRSWVQDLGGGFLMLGGQQSFGPGGYYKSTLEDVLPVRSDFDKEKEKPSLGIVLVIDKSGSMQGEKLDMARAAAQSTVELLGPRDQIAVVAFDGETFVISDMQTATNKGQISEQIAGIQQGGGTEMYPAMRRAFEMLSGTTARLKHVIMLTDGISNSGDFEGLAQQMAAAKITLSTVAVGEEGETDTQVLQSIARIGKGRFYATADPSQVPQIFAKETITAGKSAVDEQPFIPQVVRATQALAEIDFESAPMLLGYVTTRPKPTCELILATEKGDPLLAWWRYGLGMTAAFTSDAKSRWSAEWLTWPGYGKFWTQVVRHLMRKNDQQGLEISTVRFGRETRIIIDAATERGAHINHGLVEVTVIDPQLRRIRQTAPQVAPGRYETTIATPLTGAYNIDAAITASAESEADADLKRLQQSRGLMIGYSDELRIRPTNESLLRQISTSSGGRFNPAILSLFERPKFTAPRAKPLWPMLLMLAAILIIIDVALRRIDLRSTSQSLLSKVRTATR
ncbi:MAG: VWA domain-containing protein [Planctomycetota bacterium]